LRDRWPINLHLIGKDILRFHAVYWPAMLMSVGLPLPPQVFGHGFLTKDGQKMGKSLGNTLDPVDLVDRYGADAVRYYFMKEVEFGRDGDFSEQRFIDILNADLANDLGNLLNRALGMANKYCQGSIPDVDPEAIPADNPLKALGLQAGDRVAVCYQRLAFTQACDLALTLVRTGNKYIGEQAPWELFKRGEQRQVEHVIYAVLESVRLAAYLLSPIIPETSTKIYQQLGFAVNLNHLKVPDLPVPYESHAQWGLLLGNQVLPTPQFVVFPKIESLQVSAL
jgi:methionyl-tRNA synthetase